MTWELDKYASVINWRAHTDRAAFQMVLFYPSIPLALRVFALITCVLAFPTSRSTDAPLITLNYGTLQGFSSTADTESFLGIPFAQPP